MNRINRILFHPLLVQGIKQQHHQINYINNHRNSTSTSHSNNSSGSGGSELSSSRYNHYQYQYENQQYKQHSINSIPINGNRTNLFLHSNQLGQVLGRRLIHIRSKSIVWNILSSGLMAVFGVTGAVILPLIGLSFDLIMSTVGPIGAILIAHLWWKVHNYNVFYETAMSEIQKHRGAIQAITRTPFQLPHIKECDFDKQKVTRQLTNPVTNQSTPFTEKYFKCVFPIPDNHVHGNSVIEVLAYKSPLNLVQNIQTPGRSWSLSSLFTKKKKNNKNKPFKKFLLVTNINLIEANTGRVHKVFEVPESIINSMVNDEHEDNPQQQQKGATYIPQSGINRPETSDYFDTKQVKEADIVKEKKYK